MSSINPLLENYLTGIVGDGVVQVAGSLLFMILFIFVVQVFVLQQKINTFYSNITLRNFTLLSNRMPSVSIPVEIFRLFSAKQLNGIQHSNNHTIPVVVPTAILPFNVSRSSIDFEKGEPGPLPLTTIKFELDSLIPAAVEVYAGVQPAALEKHAVINIMPGLTTCDSGAVQRTNSYRQNTHRNSIVPAAEESIDLMPIKKIKGTGDFEVDSILSNSDAFYCCERIRVPAKMKQKITIPLVPLVDPKMLRAPKSMGDLNIPSIIKEEPSLRTGTDREVLSTSNIGDRPQILAHLHSQIKKMNPMLIPFVVVVRSLKPLDRKSNATINVSTPLFTGEVDLSNSQTWFLLYGRFPSLAHPNRQSEVFNDESVRKTTTISSPPLNINPSSDQSSTTVAQSGENQQEIPRVTFRLDHIQQFSYIPVPQTPPPHNYKWLNSEELFGSISSSSTNLAVDLSANSNQQKDNLPPETNTSTHKSNSSLSENDGDAGGKPQCCICLSDEATIMILPCRHVCSCFECFRGTEQPQIMSSALANLPTSAPTQEARMKRDLDSAKNGEFVEINTTCDACPVCRAKIRAWIQINKS